MHNQEGLVDERLDMASRGALDEVMRGNEEKSLVTKQIFLGKAKKPYKRRRRTNARKRDSAPAVATLPKFGLTEKHHSHDNRALHTGGDGRRVATRC